MAERPDREALLRWLVSPDVVSPGGEVMSWRGSGAFAYPEAGGLLLRLLARERIATGCADAIASWLAHTIETRGVGRAGRRYAFDLAAVVGGLAAHVRSREPRIEDTISSALRRASFDVVEALEVMRAVDGESDARWSARFGPHMRKCVHFLQSDVMVFDHLWRVTGRDAFDPCAPTPGEKATYLHACLYALEGTPVLAEGRGRGDCMHAAMAWLARLQRSNGGMPAWADGERGFGPARADTTAQAVRLWAWLEPGTYAAEIGRGLDWLARATMPGGGVRYSEDSDHQNTWATVFTIQALDFAERRGASEALL